MLYLIVRFNLILRLSVTLLHESKGHCCSPRSLVFRFTSGVLGVIHRDFPLGSGGDPLQGRGVSRHSLLSGRYEDPEIAIAWLAVLDPTVCYAGGDNGENHRDQWPRVECAREEIRRQQNEERYSRGQDG